ncbi:MAG: lysylphosphatidylglycerol synthase domain-containing protein [Rhizomicrobium sp.]
MHMKFGAIVALLAGLALAVFVFLHIGIAPVLSAIARVGWGGFVLIVLGGLGVIAFLSAAWYTLLSDRAHWPIFFAARQLRDSASELLPFTQLGGMVIGVRAIILGGLAAPRAFASAMVDVTMEFTAEIAFVLLGLMLGIAQLRASPALAPYANGLIVGTALLVPGVIGFVVLQRRGSFLAEKLASRFLPAAVSHTEAFSQALNGFYSNRWRLLLSATLHLTAWIASGVWLWGVMRLCGAHVSVFSAITIESLLGALRGVTFFIPSSVGVQEAGYAALASVFGAGPEVGLAVSLLKRARDIVVGVPVLLAWQIIEGKRAFALRNGDSS